MPRSPQWMDLYQIWFRGSCRGRNQLCGILLQSARGFRFCEGSKFAISHWLGRSPLTQCWRYRTACDWYYSIMSEYGQLINISCARTFFASPVQSGWCNLLDFDPTATIFTCSAGVWRHIFAVDVPLLTKSGSPMQNDTPISVKRSRSKPEVEFQYGGRLFFQYLNRRNLVCW